MIVRNQNTNDLVQSKPPVDSLSADCQESILALSASVLTERANYLHPKELQIHDSVSVKHFTEVLSIAQRAINIHSNMLIRS
jgi:hypothetical protein